MALCVYALLMSRLLLIFNINVDVVHRYLFIETLANASHQHAVVPMTAAKRWTPVSSQGWKPFYIF